MVYSKSENTNTCGDTGTDASAGADAVGAADVRCGFGYCCWC